MILSVLQSHLLTAPSLKDISQQQVIVEQESQQMVGSYLPLLSCDNGVYYLE